jgi:hypothetical protein
MKLGKISGFRLASGNETIYVASDTLPSEGSTVAVYGTVMQEFLVGTYIMARDVQPAGLLG